MKEVNVSIIIPLLNSISYLKECIQSIRNQTLKNIQLIFVDAGSNDGSLELIEYYKKRDERILLIHSTEKSYGHQVNLGIEASCGEYIGIVESDDKVAPDFYEKLYGKTHCDKPDFIKGGFTQFARVLQKEAYDKVQRSDDRMEQIIQLKECESYRFFDLVHIWSGIYKREFLLEKKISMNPTKGASYQDTSFSLLIAFFADTCLYTSECGYFYRIDNVNSSVKSDEKVCCIIDEYDYLIKVLKERNLYDEQRKAAIEKYRLVSYFWNFRRMKRAGREQFLFCIHESMQKIKMEAKNLSRSDLEVLKYLSNLDGAKLFEQTEEVLEIEYKKFLSLLQKRQRYHCIVKEQQARKLFYVQDTFSLDFVEEVYPSIFAFLKTKKKGNLLFGKNITKEMKQELVQAGIEEKQLYYIKYIPSFSWMVEHLETI